MSIAKEFREFAVKGNVVDMAVGIIIGAAFGKIVSSLVADVITPPIGFLLSGVKFQDLKLSLGGSPDPVTGAITNAVTINYGQFLQATFDFIIVAFVIFLLIKGINTLKKKEEAKPAPPAPPSKEELLLTEIRDLLKKKG